MKKAFKKFRKDPLKVLFKLRFSYVGLIVIFILTKIIKFVINLYTKY